MLALRTKDVPRNDRLRCCYHSKAANSTEMLRDVESTCIYLDPAALSRTMPDEYTGFGWDLGQSCGIIPRFVELFNHSKEGRSGQ